MIFGSSEFDYAIREPGWKIKEMIRLGFPLDWIEVSKRCLYAYIRAVKSNTRIFNETGDIRYR